MPIAGRIRIEGPYFEDWPTGRVFDDGPPVLDWRVVAFGA